jgi:hypothetical protein
MAHYPRSVSQYFTTEPFELQVARGQIPDHTLVNIQGFNTAQSTAFRAVWEKSNTTDYVYPTAAVPMSFTSSLSETLTLTVFGLDDTYAVKTAVVTFAGSTTGTVTTGTSTFFRINAMQITSGTAAGTISATNSGTTYAQINTGLGRSQASIYTVPLGFTFYLTRAQAFTTNNGAQYCTYRVYSQTISGGITTPNIVLAAPFAQSYMSTRVVPRAYAQKTDIQWQLSQSNSAPGSVQLEGILIANGYENPPYGV